MLKVFSRVCVSRGPRTAVKVGRTYLLIVFRRMLIACIRAGLPSLPVIVPKFANIILHYKICTLQRNTVYTYSGLLKH